MSSPLSNSGVRDSGLRQKGDPFGYHHRIGGVFSPFLYELSPNIQMLFEEDKVFLMGPFSPGTCWDKLLGRNEDVCRETYDNVCILLRTN